MIGGSLIFDLRRRGFADRIIGVDTNQHHRKIALLCGYIDEHETLENAVDKSDLILLTTPVNTNRRMLPGILDRVYGTAKVVADMGSTKGSIAGAVHDHPARGRYVAVHPMAGTEHSGPLATTGKLFDNKTAIICDKQYSDADALQIVEEMLEVLNMKKVYMDADDHDIHVAYISHISHITSFSLALSVLEKEQEAKNILTLAGGGFESTVRLANSNAETWAPIFLDNAEHVLEVLDTYVDKMQEFKRLIRANDSKGLKELIAEANRISAILNYECWTKPTKQQRTMNHEQ